jgi:hypothetical protein
MKALLLVIGVLIVSYAMSRLVSGNGHSPAWWYVVGCFIGAGHIAFGAFYGSDAAQQPSSKEE